MLSESFSGIRGIYGKDITLDIARKYAFVFQEFMKKKAKKKQLKIVVGMDTRPSSLAVKMAVLEALDSEIIDVDYASTPATEHAVRCFNADCGIMITASHNEPEYNGFKFLDKDGGVLRGKDAAKVIAMFLKIRNKTVSFRKNNRVIVNSHRQLMQKYTDFIFELVGKQNIEAIRKFGLKIVIDPNGGTGFIAYQALNRAGVDVIGVNTYTGRFNRAIEPNEASLAFLKKHIVENIADLAAGFDCDADRVEILDDKGNMLNGHKVLALLIDSYFLNAKKQKRPVVVVNDATSNLVKEIASRYKAKVKEVEVGEANVVEAMAKLKSPIGGEGSSSGCILWPSRCRDGIIGLMMILSIIAKKGKRLSEIIANYPSYYEARAKLSFNLKKHDTIKKKLIKYYKKKRARIQQLSGIKGGLKIIPDKKSFVYFRASQTEAGQFRIIADSDNRKKSDDMLKEALSVFKKIS